MKVKELIAHLEMLPQNAEVYIYDYIGDKDEDPEVPEYNEESNSVIIYY